MGARLAVRCVKHDRTIAKELYTAHTPITRSGNVIGLVLVKAVLWKERGPCRMGAQSDIALWALSWFLLSLSFPPIMAHSWEVGGSDLLLARLHQLSHGFVVVEKFSLFCFFKAKRFCMVRVWECQRMKKGCFV